MQRNHPIPFRTRKLSFVTPMVLHGRPVWESRKLPVFCKKGSIFYLLSPFLFVLIRILSLIYRMDTNIFKIVKNIPLILFFSINFLFSECKIILTENFFNDEVVGYYLSAIDIDTGQSNLLLFDYQIDFIDCDEYPDLDKISVDFNININLPNHTDDQISIIEGTFKLNNININTDFYSISFRNTDLNSNTINLPSGVGFSMSNSDYTIGITKVWEREDQYELYKNDEKYKPLRWRSWFSYGLPKWFIDFSRKYF